jgi:hypothetical protein
MIVTVIALWRYMDAGDESAEDARSIVMEHICDGRVWDTYVRTLIKLISTFSCTDQDKHCDGDEHS